MNRIVNLSTALVVAFALSLLIYLLASPGSASAAFAEFPVGQTRTVSFDARREAPDGATRRERLDQLRDWLLFTTVSASGLNAEQINQSMFDVPAIRQGYMEKVANFEYGDTRSCYLGGGQVVALVPPSGDEERADRLAQIADQQRKNLGAMPETISVFEYRLDPNTDLESASATLTRRENVNARDLFTESGGYYESGISNLKDLEEFLRRVDDITYARTAGGRLTLGGRKLRGHQYRGIRVEDAAAIWQSGAKIHAGLDPQKQKIDEFNRRWENRTYNSPSEGLALRQQHDREEKALKAELESDAAAGKLANGSGFSLDPTYDFDSLSKEFDTHIAPLLRKLLGGGPASADFSYALGGNPFAGGDSDRLIEKASAGLRQHEIGPLLDALDQLSKSDDPVVKLVEDGFRRRYGYQGNLGDLINDDLTHRFGFQAARYDGDLKGTEVGMSLFYTDLLAKLWALDYVHSAPQHEVNGFKAMTATFVSTAYKKEMGELPNTRLWFGPRDKGFQYAGGGDSILFARTATRVYAASSNPLRPGAESQANAQSAAFLGWWDDHYEEVARFEPEYERLNEIMKWSLLVSWLNKAGQGDKLGFLKAVEVDHSNWFPEWVKRHDGLRFHDWEKVGFYQPGYKGSSTEAMPLLSSEGYKQFGVPMFLSGGVSLADEGLFEGRVALSEETQVGQLLRRSNLDYSAGELGGELRSLEGTAYKFESAAPERAVTTASVKGGIKLRGSYGELSNMKFERVVAQEGDGLRINTQVGGIDLGGLDISRTGNGFRVGWYGLDIDLGQSLAQSLSEASQPEKALFANRAVESVISLGDGRSYVVKLRGSSRWVKLSPETEAGAGVAGWQSRVGSFADGARNYEVTWLKPDEVQFNLASSKELTVAPAREFGGRYMLKAGPGGGRAAGEAVELRSGDITIKGRFSPETGEVRFNLSDLPEALRNDPLKLQQLVAEANVTAGRAYYVVSDLAGGNSLARQLGNGDARSVVEEILKSPAEAEARFARELSDGVEQSDRLMGEGQYRDAVSQLDSLIDTFGGRPELLLRRGAAKLSEEVPQLSGTLKEAILAGKAKDPALFFEEVNQRLHLSGALPDNASLANEGGDLALHYRLDPLGNPPALTLDDIKSEGALVYVQDSPGLNNLDWSTSVHESLQQTVSGGLGTVVKLPRADIAGLKPTLIYAPDEATSFRAASQTGASAGYRFPRFYYGPNYNEDDKKKRDKEGYVYLVLARRASP
jgi:hypothetical protein